MIYNVGENNKESHIEGICILMVLNKQHNSPFKIKYKRFNYNRFNYIYIYYLVKVRQFNSSDYICKIIIYFYYLISILKHWYIFMYRNILKLIQKISKMQKKPEIIRNKADKSILISPQNPKNSLIWLHGLGDSS